MRESGFSIVELMVAMAIASVIAAAALPIYAKHIAKTQVTRVVGEISNYKRQIEDRLGAGATGDISVSPESTLGFRDSDLSSVVFGSFASEAESTITATLDGSTIAGITGTRIVLTRSAAGHWTCAISGAGDVWVESLKPKGCQ